MSTFDQEPLLEVTEALIEAGGRDLLECLACGTCSGVCPWGLVRPHSVRRLIRQAALGLEGFEPESWRCLTCRHCVERCPQEIELTEVMQAMRAVAAEIGGLPPGISAAVGSLSAAGNPWGGDSEARGRWSEELELAGDGEPLIYHACCTAAYDGRARKLALAAVKVLSAVGFRLSLLGNDEACCGDLALRAGRPDLAGALASKNAAAFDRAGGHPVVTSSPHSRQAFVGWYKEQGASVPTTGHVVEVLHEALLDGRLILEGELQARVTFHDPCYLGRYAGLYDQPRALLEAVPGLELVEMGRCREEALCCGGGGGGAFREVAQEERHALLRIDEALAVGAEVIAVACPLCLLMFEDALRVRDVEDRLRVLDISEILAAALCAEKPKETL